MTIIFGESLLFRIAQIQNNKAQENAKSTTFESVDARDNRLPGSAIK